MGKTDAEILDGSPFVVTFNGVDYEWRQHPRNVQRRARGKLMHVAGSLANVANATEDLERGALAFDAVSDVLEFCEEYNPAMKADMDSIDAYIMKRGVESFEEIISDVFQPIFDEWLKPWIDGGDDTGKKLIATKSATSTTKQNTTK